MADAAMSADEPDLLVGVVDRVELPATAYVQMTDGTVAVTFSKDAVFCRDDGYDLARFVRGDEVVVEGRRNGGAFVGTFLTIMFHTVGGRIVGNVGRQLATTGGMVTLTTHTLFAVEEPWRPLAEGDLTMGDEISVLARKDAASGSLVAAAIFPS